MIKHYFFECENTYYLKFNIKPIVQWATTNRSLHDLHTVNSTNIRIFETIKNL